VLDGHYTDTQDNEPTAAVLFVIQLSCVIFINISSVIGIPWLIIGGIFSMRIRNCNLQRI
jgi:hypothetical protein